jgi:hypothetical protein
MTSGCGSTTNALDQIDFDLEHQFGVQRVVRDHAGLLAQARGGLPGRDELEFDLAALPGGEGQHGARGGRRGDVDWAAAEIEDPRERTAAGGLDPTDHERRRAVVPDREGDRSFRPEHHVAEVEKGAVGRDLRTIHGRKRRRRGGRRRDRLVHRGRRGLGLARRVRLVATADEQGQAQQPAAATGRDSSHSCQRTNATRHTRTHESRGSGRSRPGLYSRRENSEAIPNRARRRAVESTIGEPPAPRRRSKFFPSRHMRDAGQSGIIRRSGFKPLGSQRRNSPP